MLIMCSKKIGTKTKISVNDKCIDIIVLNLMPNKIETENQISNILKELPVTVNLEFMYVDTHKYKNIDKDYLRQKYKRLTELKDKKYNGMIITGAPVEHLAFDQIDYWDELTEILEYGKNSVNSTMYICWGALAGLNYHYNVPKYDLDKKVFGVYTHRLLHREEPLLMGFDDEFMSPHSRHSEIRKEDLIDIKDLEILSESSDAGIYIVASKNKRHIFVLGHCEYGPLTLKREYERDIQKDMETSIPKNYFPQNNPNKLPIIRWKAHSRLLFQNWILNYLI